MNKITLKDVKPDTAYTADVLLDKSFLLSPRGCPFTKELLAALSEWSFTEAMTEGSVSLGAINWDDGGEEAVEVPEEPPKPNEFSKATAKAIKTAVEKQGNTEETRLHAVQTVIDAYLEYIEKVYTYYATNTELHYEDIKTAVSDLCGFMKDNRRYVLRVSSGKGSAERNFLVSHSLRTTVISIAIGMQMRIKAEDLVELGIAALIHEIGMISLPSQLYITTKRLSPAERKQLFTHPIQSHNIVRHFDFPPAVLRAVLEHHEKENGSGYPRKLQSADISLFAKIIGAACTYEAITAPRQYKDAQSSYDAMVELLRNENNQYDTIVIKALLSCLSLYPIGSFVFLTDSKIAVVVDIDPTKPQKPIVELFTEKNEDGSPIRIETATSPIGIRRALSRRETEDVIQAVQKQMAAKNAKAAPAPSQA